MSQTIEPGPVLQAEAVGKSFTLHLQGGIVLPVLDAIAFQVAAGECLALVGPSGAGKSTLLRSLRANYRIDRGRLLVRHQGDMIDLATADPRTILAIRRHTIGTVTQFLHVVPRVPALEIVAEAAILRGIEPDAARARAAALLTRLRIPARLHALPPATFSGGEQQRINLARGFVADHPILLLDEPTASLDPGNTEIVIGMIQAAKARGAAVVGIFHDAAVRNAVADRTLEVLPLQDAA